MGVSIAVATAPVETATVSRTSPRKLFRGITRTLIRKTLAKLISLQNSDGRESIRSANLGYSPALVASTSRSSVNNAFKTTIARLQAALLAQEGDPF